MAALQNETRTGELAIAQPTQVVSAARQSMTWMHRIEDHPSWTVLSRVPERTIAYIPLSHFTVGHLLKLEKGKVFTSLVLTSDLVPMKIGSVRLAWGEFEMVNQSLALRVTKLA